jgi:hypothetical protein
MGEQVVKSVRLSRQVVEATERMAMSLGLTFADIVEAGLRKEIGMDANPRMEVLKQVANWLTGQYPNKNGFPQDVTLLVFRQIQDDEGLRNAYKAALIDHSGVENDDLKWTLHRQIGQCVRRVLNARVIGRSIELDPEVELIKTHALLAPQS